MKPMALMLVKIKPMPSKKAISKSSPSSLWGGCKPLSRRVYLFPLCCLVLGIGLVGCNHSDFLGLGSFNWGNMGGNPTKISDIPQNPNVDTLVYLQGQVTNRAPLLSSGAYQLKDTTGTIWVFTNQTLPNVGDQVSIKGKVQFQSIPIGMQELGEVYVQQKQLLNRKASQPEQPRKDEG
ncbi:hypothetical protein [Allocoleopsis franciscana]|nr:hypothetical protein [Allocoleopsis franciscana]